MRHTKGFNPNKAVFINHTFINLLRIYPPSDIIGRLLAIQSVVDIRLIGLMNVMYHIGSAFGTDNPERLRTSHHPGGKDKVGQSDGMITVQVREEQPGKIARRQRGELPAIAGRHRRSTAHHTGSGIDEVGLVVDDYGHCRTRVFRIRVRIP